MNTEVALITGSTSGIGAATAGLFAEQGYHVIITGRNEDRAQEVCERIRDAGHEADLFIADLTDEVQIERLVEYSASIGRLAVLVNCVGGNKPGMSLDDHMAANYKAPRAVTEAALAHMSAGASIITVTSICSESKQAHEGGPYSDAKAALTSYSMGLVKHLLLEGIRINVVAPGLTDTRDTAHLTTTERDALSKKMPLAGRFLEPQEVAETIYSLSNLNVTGQTLIIDGGMTAVHG